MSRQPGGWQSLLRDGARRGLEQPDADQRSGDRRQASRRRALRRGGDRPLSSSTRARSRIPPDLSARDRRLLQAQMDAMREVVDEHQADINRAGVGFKGFVPALFGRLMNEKFGEAVGQRGHGARDGPAGRSSATARRFRTRGRLNVITKVFSDPNRAKKSLHGADPGRRASGLPHTRAGILHRLVPFVPRHTEGGDGRHRLSEGRGQARRPRRRDQHRAVRMTVLGPSPGAARSSGPYRRERHGTGGIPISARIAALTAAGLISLVISSFFMTQALYRSADRTAATKVLFDRAATAAAAQAAFGDLRYWLTDLSVSLLMNSQRKAEDARKRLDPRLDALDRSSPELIAKIRPEVDAYVKTALKAVDSYTRDNRIIGNALMAQARAHSAKVDADLNALVAQVSAEAEAARKSAVAQAQRTATPRRRPCRPSRSRRPRPDGAGAAFHRRPPAQAEPGGRRHDGRPVRHRHTRRAARRTRRHGEHAAALSRKRRRAAATGRRGRASAQHDFGGTGIDFGRLRPLRRP